jgi:two-component system phosphate regulon response regulator PhoB
MKQQTYQKSKGTVSATKDAHPYNILVVDDEPHFSAILSEILRSFGYIVHPVYSVQNALEVIEQERPDLILTDIMMPGIDGLTFVRKLRNDPIWSSIPTIVVTAKAHPSDVEATLSSGADACLIKPFSATDLRLTVKSFLP